MVQNFPSRPRTLFFRESSRRPSPACALLDVSPRLNSGLLSPVLSETCDVQPHKRANCGVPGITPSQCRDKGCCFDNTVRGVPWCFRPEPVLSPPEEECSL
uniref:P-type domain-containing protein n=1 Tax=Suricata suricatta TaxID=37032 RepID=A0A673SSE0_SURSU